MTEIANSPPKFCAPRSAKNRTYSLRAAPPHSVPGEIDPRVAAVAAARGAGDLESFFNPNFKASMPDPSRLADMQVAAARFAKAVEAGESIGLIGDYDVDGATSSAIVIRFLRMLGHEKVVWRIPHRIRDGYGPNTRLVDEIAAVGASLLVILDSGTAAIEPVARARSLELDVLIIDHHEAGETLPDAVLVNPKRPDEDRSLDYLCTAGLAFLFAVAVMRELRVTGFFERKAMTPPDIRGLLGLVALGTVADVVPLVGLNRAYVALGLPRMGDIAGIRALVDATGEQNFTPVSCGFVFGPCINAAGRIDDMSLGAELLVTEDPKRAEFLALQLHEMNQERQKMQKLAVQSAKDAVVETGQDTGTGVIVLHDENWHPGVVGLVAAKVREAFDKPAIIIGNSGKGSCRSVDGYNIGENVIAAYQAGLLVKGGGHAAAAGLTLDAPKLDALRAFMNASITGFEPPAVAVDFLMECGALQPDLVEAFDKLAPFGQGNPKPRIGVIGGFVRKVQILKSLHVKAWLSGSEGDTVILLFNAIGTPLGDQLSRSEGKQVDVVGVAEVSTYGGVTSVVLKPEDVFFGVDAHAQAYAA
ncbi:single-stranded-DNA-specific exonuclease RecJ (plasmid) [Bosea sp. RAC05]|nr:single-stranded-DNA-specific exonuclease RecJ [Bosea sp. RAC05]